MFYTINLAVESPPKVSNTALIHVIGLTVVIKAFFAGISFRGAYFRRGLSLEGIFRNEFGLSIKSKNTNITA